MIEKAIDLLKGFIGDVGKEYTVFVSDFITVENNLQITLLTNIGDRKMYRMTYHGDTKRWSLDCFELKLSFLFDKEEEQ